MELVVVERLFTDPVTPDMVRGLQAEKAWCMELCRARCRRTHVALDGRRVTCVFAGPDADSVRAVNEKATVGFERVWTATLHGPGEPAGDPPEGAWVLVERSFPEPVEYQDVQALEDAAAWCLTAHRVRHHASYFARNRRRMVCLYTAPDADSVRLANEKAGLPFEAVWPATLIVF